MGLTFVKDLPTPAEIREQFPLADNLAQLKSQKDEEQRNKNPVNGFRGSGKPVVGCPP